MPPLRLFAVTGMTAEARCLPPGLPHACSGGDADRAEALARAAVADGAGLLLSFGLAGGLAPGLRAGDLVAATHVLDDRGGTMAACVVLGVTGAADGSVLGQDRPVAAIADKAALYRTSGAAIVDMESHRLARVAAEARVGLAVLRAVLDPADQRLPPAAMVGLGPDGRMRPSAVIRALARRPGDLPDLLRLAVQTRRGLARLRSAAAAGLRDV